MPVKRLKYTANYCKRNIFSFAVILISFFILNYILNNAQFFSDSHRIFIFIIWFILILFNLGYGMLITRDIIRNIDKLPKIKFRETLVFGIKSSIVIVIYGIIQLTILNIIADNFHFHTFELESAIINFSETIELFYTHDPVKTVLFIIISAIVTYILVFFMEITLARLADKGSLKSALNIISVKHCIDIIGWRHYTVDYTKLILTIAVLTYIKYGIHMSALPNTIFDVIINLLIFIVEYIGIGMIYNEYVEKKIEDEGMPVEIE